METSKEMKVFIMSEMPKEERDKLINDFCCPKIKEAYESHEKEGFFDRCHKTDYCKEMREKQEMEQKQKDELIKTQTDKLNELQAVIIQQNQVLAQIIDKIKNI